MDVFFAINQHIYKRLYIYIYMCTCSHLKFYGMYTCLHSSMGNGITKVSKADDMCL